MSKVLFGFEFFKKEAMIKRPLTRLVIDTSFLKAPELETWLTGSTDNVAVISELQFREAGNADTVEKLVKNFSILSRHTRQVQIQKPLGRLIHLPPILEARGNRLIDSRATSFFPYLCEGLAATAHSEIAREYFKAHMKTSLAASENLRTAMEKISASAGEFLQEFHINDIKDLRRGIYSDRFQIRFVEVAAVYAVDWLSRQPPRARGSGKGHKELAATFIFRFILCYLLFVHLRAAKGDPGAGGGKKHRSDFVDSILIASSLYFDGYLTLDGPANYVAGEARNLIEMIQGEDEVDEVNEIPDCPR